MRYGFLFFRTAGGGGDAFHSGHKFSENDVITLKKEMEQTCPDAANENIM